MSTVEIKEVLHNHINSIDNENLLQRILDLVNEENQTYELSEEQKRRILKGKQEISEGKFKTHEQVKKEVREWLKK